MSTQPTDTDVADLLDLLTLLPATPAGAAGRLDPGPWWTRYADVVGLNPHDIGEGLAHWQTEVRRRPTAEAIAQLAYHCLRIFEVEENDNACFLLGDQKPALGGQDVKQFGRTVARLIYERSLVLYARYHRDWRPSS